MAGFSVNYKNEISGVKFNDLYLDSNGNIVTVSGNIEVEETCYHVIQLCIGDYDFNTQLGIPWDNYLSSDNPIGNKIKLSIGKAVSAVKGVKSVEAVNLDTNPFSRSLIVTVIITLNSGDTTTIIV
jgi:hypothetical protein